MNQERSSFSSKIGFVLAAAGSAVGLGNLWRFPYLAAQYGGGIFLLVYLVLAVTFGFTLMIVEVSIGRKTRSSAVQAYGKLNKKFGFIGIVASLVPVLIFPYYCVIGGWVIKYFTVFLTGNTTAAATDTYFTSFIQKSGEPIGYYLIFIACTAFIVLLGVEKGIEKASKIMLPILVLLSVGIAIYVMTLPGAMDGVIYYLKPDFSKFTMKTVLAAMGQLFYSMSLAMGIMITYGSYMKKDNNLESAVSQIEIFDTGIAFVAGLMIVPAVFVFSGGDESVLNSGAGLMFVTLPKVFASMKMGTALGVVFFVLVFFAALTSSISLMETIVSIVQDLFKCSRKVGAAIAIFIALAIGIPVSLGYGVLDSIVFFDKLNLLDFLDFITNSLLMPIVAFLTCIFVGYIVKPKVVEDEVLESGQFKRRGLFLIVVKYIAPICLILILISSILNSLGIVKI